MAGDSLTTNFILSSATMMMGTMDELFALQPDLHSLGLVKNIVASGTPTFVDLTQGVEGTVVFSTMTNNKITVSADLYEFTTRNMQYALGLASSNIPTGGLVANTAYPLTAAITGAGTPDIGPNVSNPGAYIPPALGVTTLTFSGPPGSPLSALPAGFVVGAWISIQDPAAPDMVHIAQITAATFTTPDVTLTFTQQPILAGTNFSTNAVVRLLNVSQVGSTINQPFFSAKFVGVMPATAQPVTLLLPKVRVIKGFHLSFDTEKYADMPFELEPYNQVQTDPFYSLPIFSQNTRAALLMSM